MRLKGHWVNGKIDRYSFCIFFLVSFVVYFTALKNYFINDDLIYLDFVKNFKGGYLDFLFPHRRPSDLVTHARYEPFHIYFYVLLYKLLHAFFPAYQLLNITFHSLNVFLIYKIGKKINIPALGAFLASLFFCVYRLNSQNVLWYATLFCTFAFSLLLLAFLLFLGNSRKGSFCSVLLFFISTLLTLKAPQYLLLAGTYLWVFRKELTAQGVLHQKIKIFSGYVAICIFSLSCNIISWHYFPNAMPKFQYDFFGLFAFFLNLISPYENGFLLKLIILFLLSAVIMIHKKDKVVTFLAASILSNALFWCLLFSATHLPYAPRYFYMAAALFSLLLGHLLNLVVQSGLPLRRFAAVVFIIFFIVFNISLVISQDTVWFNYLSIRGQKLNKLSRLPGPGKKKVSIKDDFFSEDPNLDYFKDKLEFVAKVPAQESGVYLIDLERDNYVKYFGYDFGKQYWFQPWLIKARYQKNTVS